MFILLFYRVHGFSAVLLILGLALIICPVVAIFLIKYLNWRYKNTNFYRDQFIDIEKFKLGNPPYYYSFPRNLEVVNLGSSQPYFAFDYSGTELLGMNWAVKPQVFECDFLILKLYHSFLKEKAFVLIPVCPFNFFAAQWFNPIKYYALSSIFGSHVHLIPDYSYRKKQIYIDYPLLAAGRNLIRLVKDVPSDKSLEIASNPMDSDQMKNDANRWMDIWLNQFSLGKIDALALSRENEESIQKNTTILHEMIEFCLKRNYRPVIMTLPASTELTALFPASFVNEQIQGNIKKANTHDVPVLNYWDDRRFMKPEYFFNAFFFNTKGRKAFTETVVSDLQKLS
jgi:hypothetical protein